MEFIIQISPILLVLLLLLLKQHVLTAALAGGVLAMILGKLAPSLASDVFLQVFQSTVGVEMPIIYAALGGLLYQTGAFKAITDLCSLYPRKGHLISLTAFLVLVHGVITYMIGLAVGTTCLIAPILAAVAGAVPQVVASLAIISAVGFSVSPVSPETYITAHMAQRDILEHAAAMLPLTIILYLLAAALAAYGIWKHGSVFKPKTQSDAPICRADIKPSLRKALPALAFLVMLIAGYPLNLLVGHSAFTPLLCLVIVPVLVMICTPLGITKTYVIMVDNSRFILMILFTVGIFLGFINIMGQTGTFSALAGLAHDVPKALIVPAAMLLGFLVAIPAGAFCTSVLALMLPTLATMGMNSVTMGFVAIAVALGAHLSPVQVNLGALKDSFQMTLAQIIRLNLPYILGALILLMAVAALKSIIEA